MKLLINYTIISTSGSTIKTGTTIRSKLAENEFIAKVRFEEFCKKQYPTDFGKLIIHSCEEEMTFDDGIMNAFGGIFKNIFK